MNLATGAWNLLFSFRMGQLGNQGKWIIENSCVGWPCFGRWPLFASKSSSRNQPVPNVTHTFGSTYGEFLKSWFKDSSWISLLMKKPYPYITEVYSDCLSIWRVYVNFSIFFFSFAKLLYVHIFPTKDLVTVMWQTWTFLGGGGWGIKTTVKHGLFQKNLDINSLHFRLIWDLVKMIMLQNIEIIPWPIPNYFTSISTETF